jgi:hypothetical protein
MLHGPLAHFTLAWSHACLPSHVTSHGKSSGQLTVTWEQAPSPLHTTRQGMPSGQANSLFLHSSSSWQRKVQTPSSQLSHPSGQSGSTAPSRAPQVASALEPPLEVPSLPATLAVPPVLGMPPLLAFMGAPPMLVSGPLPVAPVAAAPATLAPFVAPAVPVPPDPSCFVPPAPFGGAPAVALLPFSAPVPPKAALVSVVLTPPVPPEFEAVPPRLGAS